jgi:hypothetical protein
LSLIEKEVKAAWLSITSPKRKEGKTMSENNTQETNQSRSFEERVFLRFDAVDARLEKVDARLEKVDGRLDKVDMRLDSLDGRVEKLEMKQYDTKPIWEQALAAIAETSVRMEQGFEQVKAEFGTLRHEIEHSLHGVERKIDALNHNILYRPIKDTPIDGCKNLRLKSNQLDDLRREKRLRELKNLDTP